MKKNVFIGVLVVALIGSSGFARYQQTLAQVNREQALQNAILAEEQQRLAQHAQQEAERQRALAEAQAAEAQRQRAEEELRKCRGRK